MTTQSVDAEIFELMPKTGRVPFLIDFKLAKENRYNEPEKARKRVQHPAEGNCWSSHAILGFSEGWHLPCFDVDRDPNSVPSKLSFMVGTPGESSLRIGALIQELFPEAEPRWVPSTTSGHHHVYVDWPYLWDDYLGRLEKLMHLDIVEVGYYYASRERGVSFVRMPGVLKEEDDNPPSAMDGVDVFLIPPFVHRPATFPWGEGSA